jgi:hypothetical protein
MSKAKGSTAAKVVAAPKHVWTRLELNAIIVGQGNWWEKKHELEDLTDSDLRNLNFDVPAYHMFFLCLISKINKDCKQGGKFSGRTEKVKLLSARKIRLIAMGGILQQRIEKDRQEAIPKVALKKLPAKHKKGTSWVLNLIYWVLNPTY